MSRAHRITNLFAVVVPFAAFLAAVVLLWNRAVSWTDLALLLGLYVLTGLGITIGYHRLLTHRAFATSPALRAIFAWMGTLAIQGAVITWVADHRKHHAFTDEEGDPHSPHASHGGGWRGALKGLVHAHFGWLLTGHGRAEAERYAPDLLAEPSMRFLERTFLGWAAFSLLLPFGLGWALTGELSGAFTGLLWGGLVRVFLLDHVTWSINSVCHFFGRRRFDTDDESRNVFWLALPSFGEAWHHNHHAFPTSAIHGLRAWEIDPSALVIRTLERLGLIWDVRRVAPEKQAAKALPRPA